MSALLSTARGFGKRGRDDMSSLLSTARGFGKRGQMSSLLSTARGFGKRSAEVAPIVIPKTDRDAKLGDEGHNIGGSGPNTNSGISFVNENIHCPGSFLSNPEQHSQIIRTRVYPCPNDLIHYFVPYSHCNQVAPA